MKSYAGIGSRRTPREVLNVFKVIAEHLAKKGYTLRSGGAEGADKAFEEGCDSANGHKEIYLPWKSFNGSNSELVVNNPTAFIIAEVFHPNWHRLSEGAKKLQARNSHQVLGGDLGSSVDFLLCWTEGGTRRGGTGQAIRIAKNYNIPVFDAGHYTDLNILWHEINKFIEGVDK